MTKLLLTLLSLLSLSGCSYGIAYGSTVAQHLHLRQLQQNGQPILTNLIGRAFHSSIVVGDYLYIDGGERNFLNNGEIAALPDNNTYSIDLRTTWSNRTVSLNRIQKTAPLMNYVSLWKDPSDKAFYAYGGEQSWALSPAQSPPVTPNSLWKFTVAGNSGSWSQVSMASNSIFPSLVRTIGGMSTYGNDLGLLLGGYAYSRTGLETDGSDRFMPIPGLLTYNMISGVWENNSATDFSKFGTAMHGEMQYVPDFGERGLFIIVGGGISNLISWQDRGSNLLSFRTVYIYDPSSKTWHNQTASGAIPQSRDRFCSVSVRGDNGTYEIFIFGGHVASADGVPLISPLDADKARNAALNEVFVLTLPGFTWQKANHTPTHPRVGHSCNLVGKRQMVVIGGLNPTSSNTSVFRSVPDIWANGIGIFDLSEMQWKDTYNANADGYTTLAAVKRWYQQNGRYPSKWDNQRVKAYFVKDRSSNNSTSDHDSASGVSASDSPKSDNGKSGKSSNTGVIVGGVVGGVVGVVFLGGALWVFLRSRRHQKSRPISGEKDWYGTIPNLKPELAADGLSLTSYSRPRQPVHGIDVSSAVEAGGAARYEMQG